MQGPAGGLDHAALDLVRQPVRVDDLARIGGGERPRHTDLASLAVDFDLGDHRHVGRQVLIFGEGDAAPARTVALLALLPPGFSRRCVYHRPSAPIAEMRQPERDRIPAGSGSQLVHERLDSKHVGVRAESAECRDAQWHSGDQVIDHSLIGKLIKWHSVTVAAARGLGNIGRRPRSARLGDIPAGQKIVIAAGGGRSGAVCIAPDLVDPVDNPAIFAERGFGAARAWPSHMAPRRIRRRASIASAPAAGEPRGPTMPRREPRRQRRCARSSPNLLRARNEPRRDPTSWLWRDRA